MHVTQNILSGIYFVTIIELIKEGGKNANFIIRVSRFTHIVHNFRVIWVAINYVNTLGIPEF